MDRLPEALALQRDRRAAPGVTPSPSRAGWKIALVSPYDFAYPGGVTEHVVHLAEQFRVRGHEVHIIAPSSDDENEPLIAAQAPVHRIGRVVALPANGSVARITLSMRAYLQAKRLLREQRFDIIHLHEPMVPWLPLTVLRHSNATNIGTFHAFRNTPLAYFYGKPILQPFFKKLHGRIAVSPAARDFVGEYFKADYRVIPNGIDYARFHSARRAEQQAGDGRMNVLFVGRLEKRKGLKFLLRAWPMVHERFPQARLTVVGGGPGLEAYRSFAARQGWSPATLRFTGYVPAEELPRYYKEADIFCAPATGQESFGIVLLEAMAAGAPIVASAIPGYCAVVHPGVEGLLVEPKQPQSLAAAIRLLLGNPELRAQMSWAGQETARRYDWPRIAGEVLDYYREVQDRRATEPEPQRLRFLGMRSLVGLLTRV